LPAKTLKHSGQEYCFFGEILGSSIRIGTRDIIFDGTVGSRGFCVVYGADLCFFCWKIVFDFQANYVE